MYSLVFESLENGSNIEIKLYSHYTCICGDSGEGKTHFVSTVEDGINSEELRVYVKDAKGIRDDISFVVANAATIGTVLKVDALQVILIDEITMLNEGILKSLDSCKHYILAVTRSDRIKSKCDKGIYNLVRGKDLSFELLRRV